MKSKRFTGKSQRDNGMYKRNRKRKNRRPSVRKVEKTTRAGKDTKIDFTRHIKDRSIKDPPSYVIINKPTKLRNNGGRSVKECLSSFLKNFDNVVHYTGKGGSHTVISATDTVLKNISLYNIEYRGYFLTIVIDKSTYKILSYVSTGNISIDNRYIKSVEEKGKKYISFRCNSRDVLVNSSSSRLAFEHEDTTLSFFNVYGAWYYHDDKNVYCIDKVYYNAKYNKLLEYMGKRDQLFGCSLSILIERLFTEWEILSDNISKASSLSDKCVLVRCVDFSKFRVSKINLNMINPLQIICSTSMKDYTSSQCEITMHPESSTLSIEQANAFLNKGYSMYNKTLVTTKDTDLRLLPGERIAIYTLNPYTKTVITSGSYSWRARLWKNIGLGYDVDTVLDDFYRNFMHLSTYQNVSKRSYDEYLVDYLTIFPVAVQMCKLVNGTVSFIELNRTFSQVNSTLKRRHQRLYNIYQCFMLSSPSIIYPLLNNIWDKRLQDIEQVCVFLIDIYNDYTTKVSSRSNRTPASIKSPLDERRINIFIQDKIKSAGLDSMTSVNCTRRFANILRVCVNNTRKLDTSDTSDFGDSLMYSIKNLLHKERGPSLYNMIKMVSILPICKEL